MSKSNIFNRPTTITATATLPNSVEITDNTNSLSTSSLVTNIPSLISLGSTVVEKDLKVQDIAYLNECRINTLPAVDTLQGQGFFNYVTLSGEKNSSQEDVLNVHGNLKVNSEIKATTATITSTIECNDITLNNTKAAKSFFAGPVSGPPGCPLFRKIETTDLPALNFVASNTTQDPNVVLAGPSSGAAAEPTFRALVSADIPTLNYVSSSTKQNPNVVLAGPSTGTTTETPTFRALVADDIPELEYLPSNYLVPYNKVFAGATDNSGGDNSIPVFRELVVADFKSVSNLNSKIAYLGVAAAGGKPTWQNLDSATIKTIVDGFAAAVVFAVVPTFPAQAKNLVFASSSTDNDKNPSFRALTVADLPSTIVNTTTTRAANKIFAGPINGSDAGPTFRSLVATDIPDLSSTYVSATTTRNANLIFAGPSTGTLAPAFRNLTERDLPGYPGGQRYNSTTNGQFLGSVYYTTTSATFYQSITILANNVIQLVSNVTNTAPGVTPVVNGQLGGVVLQINTGIKFSTGFSTSPNNIVAETTYYIKSFTATIASSITTYTITVSDTMGGAVKTLNALATATSSTLSVVNYPTGFRNITSADLKTTVSGVTPVSPPFDPENPDYVAPQEILVPSNVVILDQTQSANQICAAPNGASGTPSFRSLVAADIPDLSSTYAPKSNSPNYVSSSNTQIGNTVLAGPNGGSGPPTFRSLVAADIPDLSSTYAPKNGSSNYVNISAPSITSNLTLPTTYNGVANPAFPTSAQLGGIITASATNAAATSNSVIAFMSISIPMGVWNVSWRGTIFPVTNGNSGTYTAVKYVFSTTSGTIVGNEHSQIQLTASQTATNGGSGANDISGMGNSIVQVLVPSQTYYLNGISVYTNTTSTSSYRGSIIAVRIA